MIITEKHFGKVFMVRLVKIYIYIFMTEYTISCTRPGEASECREQELCSKEKFGIP